MLVDMSLEELKKYKLQQTEKMALTSSKKKY